MSLFLPLCSERSVFTNLAHGFFFSDAELRDSNEEMRRKGKDPCILGQFLGSQNPCYRIQVKRRKKKKKKVSDSVDIENKELRAEKKNRKSLIVLESCRPFCDCARRWLAGERPECSACGGEEMRSQQVTCKHTRAHRTVQLMPLRGCAPRACAPRARPLGRRPCSSHPCVQWLLEPGNQGTLTNLIFLIVSQSL